MRVKKINGRKEHFYTIFVFFVSLIVGVEALNSSIIILENQSRKQATSITKQDKRRDLAC